MCVYDIHPSYRNAARCHEVPRTLYHNAMQIKARTCTFNRENSAIYKSAKPATQNLFFFVFIFNSYFHEIMRQTDDLSWQIHQSLIVLSKPIALYANASNQPILNPLWSLKLKPKIKLNFQKYLFNNL